MVAILAGPILGRFVDRFGKFNIFVFGSLLTIAAVFVYTRLSLTPLIGVIAVNAFIFMGVSARMISSQALISAVPTPESRGAFMSISASIQQISGGFASVIAGVIVVQAGNGPLQNFDVLGDVVIGASLLTLAMMYLIQKRIGRN
jgi:MFS family permease